MDNLMFWGYEVPGEWLTQTDRDYLASLPSALPTVEWVWSEMDRVWRSLGMDNKKPLSDQRVAEFYSHPVWLMNGFFTRADPLSSGHRAAIASYLHEQAATHIADYGGGFGELALAAIETIPDVEVSIVEPFPSRAGLERLRKYGQISFVESPAVDTYDAIVAQDVLEHVEDPVQLAYAMANSVRPNGHVIFANCFVPVIECHLPSTFHLRHTFKWVIAQMGLEFVGRVPGAEHAQIFRRVGSVSLDSARRAERLSKLVGPGLNGARKILSTAKGLVVP